MRWNPLRIPAAVITALVLVVTLAPVAWATRVGGSVTALGAVATAGTKERA